MIKRVIWDSELKGSHVPFKISLYNSHLIPLNYISQVGPQCGFAALCMIASSVGLNLHPDALVSKAKQKNITNYGELFSAQDLTTFAEDILSFNFEVTLQSCSISGLCYQLKKYLDEDNLILIPYDCDFNNEPCLRNGAAAHWAVLCGYVDGGSEENFYVIACHGKSEYASVWKFSDLQQSNDNLNELGVKRMTDNRNYVVPYGGLRKGIASKWILFKKKMYVLL